MRSCELKMTCEYCDKPVTAADSLPFSHGQNTRQWVGLCRLHAAHRRGVETSRVVDAIVCESQGIARIDRDRCGGGVLCESCGLLYYAHPRDADYPFLNVLCDGSLVKL